MTTKSQAQPKVLPEVATVRAALAGQFQISETQVAFHQAEIGLADERIRHVHWRARLEEHIARCLRGENMLLPVSEAEFIWRFYKATNCARGFSRDARLRRAAERIAVAADAALERSAHCVHESVLSVTKDQCTVVMTAQGRRALIVTAYAHDPMPTAHFLTVAGRITETVDLQQRLHGLA